MISFDMVVLLLLAAALVAFIGEPLLAQRRSQQGDTALRTQEVERLNLQKEGLYTAIQDLDFDYQTGKVDQRDYTALRQQLEGEAIDTLRALDGVDPLAALDEALEQQIARLRAAAPEVSSACPNCGADGPDDAGFCAVCGQARRISKD